MFCFCFQKNNNNAQVNLYRRKVKSVFFIQEVLKYVDKCLYLPKKIKHVCTKFHLGMVMVLLWFFVTCRGGFGLLSLGTNCQDAIFLKFSLTHILGPSLKREAWSCIVMSFGMLLSGKVRIKKKCVTRCVNRIYGML